MNVKIESDRTVYKKRLVHKLLDKVRSKRVAHSKRASKYKTMDDVCDFIIVSCGTITTATVTISLVTVNPVTAIVSCVSSAIGLIASSIKSKLNFRKKYTKSVYIANTLNNLNQEMLIILGRNHLSSSDLDNILNDLNARIKLIDENSPMVDHDNDSDIKLTNTITPLNEE